MGCDPGTLRQQSLPDLHCGYGMESSIRAADIGPTIGWTSHLILGNPSQSQSATFFICNFPHYRIGQYASLFVSYGIVCLPVDPYRYRLDNVRRSVGQWALEVCGPCQVTACHFIGTLRFLGIDRLGYISLNLSAGVAERQFAHALPGPAKEYARSDTLFVKKSFG